MFGVPVPRPSCAAGCTRPFVCANPVCKVCTGVCNATSGWDSVSIKEAKVGTMCECQGAPIWDSCSVAGLLVRILRDYWLILYIGVAILEIALFMLALVAIRWPAVPLQSFDDQNFADQREKDIREHKICLLIAHYGGAGSLEETLRAALNVFPPDHIFVCHNAAREHPYDQGAAGDTLRMMHRLERELKLTASFGYAWTCEGNKTLAVYSNALKMCKEMKYCMMIDNDVLLPHDLIFPIQVGGGEGRGRVGSDLSC